MFHTQDEQGNGRPALDFPSLHINLQYDSDWTRPMKRKNFGAMQCPIARGLERVGEWWSILILRDAFAGMSRFDEFQKSLGIAPNMLTRRLTALVEAAFCSGIATASAHPVTNTASPAAVTTSAPCCWRCSPGAPGTSRPEGPSVQIVDAETGVGADPVLVDRATGLPARRPPGYQLVTGAIRR